MEIRLTLENIPEHDITLIKSFKCLTEPSAQDSPKQENEVDIHSSLVPYTFYARYWEWEYTDGKLVQSPRLMTYYKERCAKLD